jgi:hypothetical protein
MRAAHDCDSVVNTRASMAVSRLPPDITHTTRRPARESRWARRRERRAASAFREVVRQVERQPDTLSQLRLRQRNEVVEPALVLCIARRFRTT